MTSSTLVIIATLVAYIKPLGCQLQTRKISDLHEYKKVQMSLTSASAKECLINATKILVIQNVRRPTHRACYHRQPSLPGGCCICLEQFAGDSTCIAVTTSFLQKTELFVRSYCCSASPFLLMTVQQIRFCPLNLVKEHSAILRTLAKLGTGSELGGGCTGLWICVSTCLMHMCVNLCQVQSRTSRETRT